MFQQYLDSRGRPVHFTCYVHNHDGTFLAARLMTILWVKHYALELIRSNGFCLVEELIKKATTDTLMGAFAVEYLVEHGLLRYRTKEGSFCNWSLVFP